MWPMFFYVIVMCCLSARSCCFIASIPVSTSECSYIYTHVSTIECNMTTEGFITAQTDSGAYIGGIAPEALAPLWRWQNFVLILNVKKIMLIYLYLNIFRKCIPEMYPSLFQVSKYATGDFTHVVTSCSYIE